MGFGGSSLSYYAAPYSGPLPPSSSSSTLSPLAPPFTVDRVAPRATLPHDPYISPWPQHPLASDDRPHVRPPSPCPPPVSPPRPAYEPTAATAAADAPPYFGHSCSPVASVASGLLRVSSGEISRRGTNLAQVEPYYPHFRSVAATSDGDTPAFYGGSLGGSGYLGGHAALSNFQFEMEATAEGMSRGSPWVEHEDMSLVSGYGVAFHQEASTSQDFSAYEDLLSGWHRKPTESLLEKDHFKYEHLDWSDVQKNASFSSDLSEPVAVAPNASVGVCYSLSSDVPTFMEGSKTCDSNSSYGRYARQNNTDRTDPRVFYPTTSYFPAKIASNSSASASIEKSILNSLNNHEENVDAYKNDKLRGVYVSISPKEPSIDLNFDYTEDYAELNRESISKSDRTSVGPSVVKITLPSTMESATRISPDRSLEKKSELRLAKLNIPGSVVCKPGQSFSEMIDENLAVDSPCWKGASSSRRSASGTFDTVSATSAPMEQKIDNPCKRGSDYKKIENEEVVQHSSGLRKDRNIVMPMKEIGDNFEPKNGNIKPALNDEKNNISATNVLGTENANHCTEAVSNEGNLYLFCSPAKDQYSLESTVTDVLNGKPSVVPDPSSKNSTLGIDVKLLVNTIHNLSGLLSSTCLLDENPLNDHEEELLLSAINNLDKCIPQKAETERMWPKPFCLDKYLHKELSTLSEDSSEGRFQAQDSKSLDGNMDQRNNRSTYSGKEKMHSVSSTVGSDKLRNLRSACDDNNFKKTQLSEVVMHENLFGHLEKPQITPCESLWLEVEDAVNSLRQKIHVLKSNIGEACKQPLTKDVVWVDPNMLKLSSQNSTNNIIGESMQPLDSTDNLSKNSFSPGNQEKTSNFLKPELLVSSSTDSKIDDIDSSVMARYKVLKGRTDKSNSLDVEEQHGQLNSFNVTSHSRVHENICSPCPSDGKHNSEMKFQPTLDAPSAGWGYYHLFHSGVTEGRVNGGSCIQYNDADYTGGPCLNYQFSEHKMMEGFRAQGAGGLANQSYPSDGRLKNFIADGSSDWEHVLKEELTM